MSKRDEERGRFIERMRLEGVPEHVTRLVMRHAATLTRLAEAQCNGDYPADNGERDTVCCDTCGTAWAPEAFKRSGPFRVACWQCGWRDTWSHNLRRTAAARALWGKLPVDSLHAEHGTSLHVTTEARCPDCRMSDRVKALLAPYNVEPKFQGDPRGAVVKLKVPSGKTDDWGQEGLCVP